MAIPPPDTQPHCVSSSRSILATLEAAQGGDPGSLDRLLRAADRFLSACVAPRLRGGWTEDWVDNVVQTSLLDLLRSYQTCEARTEAEVRAWIHAIGRREIATFFRAESFQARARAIPSIAPPEWRPDFEVKERPLVARLRRAVATMSAEQHLLLWLRLQERATWPEIARDLGTTAAGAKRRYQRLVRRLRARLGGTA